MTKFKRATESMAKKGVWPPGLPPPRSLERRVTYLVRRFARHAPRYELIIWVRQAVLLFLTISLDPNLGKAALLPIWEKREKEYITAATALVVLLISWRLQLVIRPYVLRKQNALDSWLFNVEVAVLILGCTFTVVVTENNLSDDELQGWLTVIEVILAIILLLACIGGGYAVVRDLKLTQHALQAFDLGAVLTSADLKIEGPLAKQLGNGTLRLLRCAWLMDTERSNRHMRTARNGAVTIPRHQELPSEAFFSPEEAAALLRRRDRSILALSCTHHGWPPTTRSFTRRASAKPAPSPAACL